MALAFDFGFKRRLDVALKLQPALLELGGQLLLKGDFLLVPFRRQLAFQVGRPRQEDLVLWPQDLPRAFSFGLHIPVWPFGPRPGRQNVHVPELSGIHPRIVFPLRPIGRPAALFLEDFLLPGSLGLIKLLL